MRTITIWDSDPARIAACRNSLALAMKSTGDHYDLVIMSEPPLLSRMELTGKTPTFEIDGMFWTWKIGEAISVSTAEKLLLMLRKNASQSAGAD